MNRSINAQLSAISAVLDEDPRAPEASGERLEIAPLAVAAAKQIGGAALSYAAQAAFGALHKKWKARKQGADRDAKPGATSKRADGIYVKQRDGSWEKR